MSLHLTAGEERLIAAAADAFFPPDGPIRRSGSEAGCVAWFDHYLGRSSRRQRLLVRLMLAFVQMAPLLLGPERRRFTRASSASRIAFLGRASTSRVYFLRVVFLSLRALMTMAYLADDSVADAIGIQADTDPFGLGDRTPLERIPPPTPQVSGVRLRGETEGTEPDLGELG